jgi:hypothetical protein
MKAWKAMVVKYEKGNFYKEHHDTFPHYEPEFLLEGGHRVLTVLIYLKLVKHIY